MKFIRRFFDWEIAHPVVILVIISIVTTFFLFFGISRFSIENPVDRLLQKDLPSKVFYDRFVGLFGKDEIILIVIKNSDGVFGKEFVDEIAELKTELLAINKAILGEDYGREGNPIREIADLSDVWPSYEIAKVKFEEKKKKRFSMIPKDKTLEFEEIVRRTKLFTRNLVSEDGKATAVTMFIESHQDDVVKRVAKVLADTEKDEKRKNWRVYQTGTAVMSREVVETVQKDVRKLSGFTMLVSVIVLFACFRRARGVMLPVLTCGVAFVWTLGLMGLLRRPMTMVTLMVPSLIIAIGNAYALHIVSEFLERSASGGEKRTIITDSLSGLTLPVLLTVSTTMVGFGSLALNKIDMIREFALFSCFGLFSILLVAMTLLPALLSLLRLPRAKPHKKKYFVEKVLNLLTDFIVRRTWAAYALLGVIAAVAVIGIMRIEIQTAVIEFFKEDHELRVNFDDVSETLSGAYPFNVVMISDEPGYFKEPEVLKKVEELQEYLETLEDIDKTISIADYIKTANMTDKVNPLFQAVPKTREGVEEIIGKIPELFESILGQVRASVTDDYRAINVICRTSFSGTKNFLKAEKKVHEYCRKNFSRDLTIEVTGLPLVIAHSADAIATGQVKSLSLAFICVFVIMTLLFMSVKVGIVAMIPNMVPVSLNFAVMGLFGIPLSSATSLIASIALGIAVDDTIHFLAKYNAEFKKDWNKERAIRETMLTVGQPIIFTSLTLGLSFAVMMLSGFQPTVLFGVLMVITMSTALVGDLVVLPALMLKTELVTVWDFVALKLGDMPRQRIPLFEGFSKWQVKKLIVAGKLERIPEGAVVFNEGDLGHTMYAIVSGGVDVVKGEEKLTDLSVGEIFGEMGIVRHKERTATIRTNRPTELLHINDATLRRVQKRFPRTATKFYNNLTKILCERLDLTTQKLFEKK